MADKPLTYPQQIQKLKTELTAAQEEKDKALEQLALLPELQEELTLLRSQQHESSTSDQTAFATNKAKETDMQQQIDSNAQLARNYSKAVQDLKAQVIQLEAQLDLLGKERFKAQDLEKKLELTAEALKSSNLRVANVSQRLRDVAIEKDEIIELQSRELQTLRLADRTNNRILSEVREALNNAPDVIGSLKYIVGINGSSTVA